MSLKFKMLRSAAGYRPGTPVEYEPLKMHHLGMMPVYETHKRKVRDPKPPFQMIEAEKIIMSADGRTPRSPLLDLVKAEDGTMHHQPRTTLIPIAAPIRLKKGSPKAVYRLLKKLERNVGLDKIYADMAKESGLPT